LRKMDRPALKSPVAVKVLEQVIAETAERIVSIAEGLGEE